MIYRLDMPRVTTFSLRYEEERFNNSGKKQKRPNIK